jgi:hypothetical protein
VSQTTRTSPKDVCLIIEAAAKAGVKTLSFAGLTVEFFGQEIVTTDVPQEIILKRNEESLVPERDPDSPLTPSEKAELFDQMLIDDPLALEEQIMSDDTETL